MITIEDISYQWSTVDAVIATMKSRYPDLSDEQIEGIQQHVHELLKNPWVHGFADAIARWALSINDIICTN